MTSPEQIVCKATPWFTFRAAAMLAMFGVFSVLFYIDGTTGYRKKNLEYYVHATFAEAGRIFSEKNKAGTLTASEWKEFSEKQTVKLPEASLLPVDTKLPMPWPDVLTDFEKMKPLQTHLLWQEYSGENGMNVKPAEHSFDAGKIREQIIVFWICLSLFLITLFFLIRTLSRSLKADEEALTTVKGKRIPYSEMTSLDLRKWDTKGIAFIDHAGSAGSGRVRIDGLTYGGFKKDKDEPAERLMQKIRENFSGELIEYTTVEEEEKTTEANENT
ncbi:MAG: hypothetical protein ACSHX9_06610 [Luteolibacter sp.]